MSIEVDKERLENVSKSSAVPALSGEQSLNRYLSEIKKYPVLTAEQEYMLAKRYEEHEDPEAAAQLVSSHLRLVAKIAMGYRGYGLPVSDLISEGNVAAQKKLFFNLRRMKKNLDAYEDTDLHPDDVTKIATDLGVPEQEVVNMNRRMMMGGDGSLNTPMRGGEEGSGEWQDWLTDDRPLQDETVADAEEKEVRHEMLVEAMQSLNEREQHILTERRLTEKPQTLEELSQVYDVSRERIRQIEVRAFEKLQKAMQRIASEKLLAGVA